MSIRTPIAISLAALLAACNPVEQFTDGIAHSKAVSAALEKSTGMKSNVGLNWANGSFVNVSVNFQGLPQKNDLAEITDKVKAAVIAEFKEKPQQLVVGFVIKP